jgi:hypothetical protein
VRRSQAKLRQINIPSGLTLSCHPLPSSRAHSAAAMVLCSGPGRVLSPSSSPVLLEPAKLRVRASTSRHRFPPTAASELALPCPQIPAVSGAHGRQPHQFWPSAARTTATTTNFGRPRYARPPQVPQQKLLPPQPGWHPALYCISPCRRSHIELPPQL